MSQRALNEEQFEGHLYHGTSAGLGAGETVLPSEHTGKETNWPMSDPGAAYATTNMRIAGGYGPRVYRVRPLGKTEPDYYFPQHSVKSEHGFKIEEEVPSHVWQSAHIPDYPER
jgi:hypothetical protein